MGRYPLSDIRATEVKLWLRQLDRAPGTRSKIRNRMSLLFNHGRRFSTLLRSTGAELTIMQELLRDSTIRVTLDTYTQAVTTEKRSAQEAVVALLCLRKTMQ